jgi:pantetheine-phosphate adenylyltransferase
MTTAAPSTALVTIQPPFTDPERLALAGFLAGYRGLTREAYALDLRQFTSWCRTRSLSLFAVRRADIEGFARDLEARGRARATVTRRLSTIAGFYKYAVEEELLDHSPAAHVRRPRQPSGTQSERAIRLRRELPADWDNVSVAAWAGLTVAFCRQHGAGLIIRGVRNQSGLRHEYQLAAMNEAMGITTLLLPAKPSLAAMSSTILRGLGT